MDEREFLIELRNRAREQNKLMHNVPFPDIFTLVAEWLGNHPWRLLIPLAFLLTVLFRAILGQYYTNLILRIFGGL